MKYIESFHNPIIKSIIQLQEKSRIRKKENFFVVEGKREISLAVQGNYEIQKILFCQEMITPTELENIQSKAVEMIKISKEVYKKIAYRDTTEGVLAVVKSKLHTLTQLQLSQNPLILVVESIEKPGNLGAIFRTVDATNIDAVIVANPKADLYNPNVIRSSVGCVFTTQIACADTKEAISFLREKNISIYSAILQEAVPYYTQEYSHPCAIVVGSEDTGLSQDWRKHSTQNIIIPMEGVIDSMNVSVAAAVLLFEAKRQRRNN